MSNHKYKDKGTRDTINSLDINYILSDERVRDAIERKARIYAANKLQSYSFAQSALFYLFFRTAYKSILRRGSQELRNMDKNTIQLLINVYIIHKLGNNVIRLVELTRLYKQLAAGASGKELLSVYIAKLCDLGYLEKLNDAQILHRTGAKIAAIESRVFFKGCYGITRKGIAVFRPFIKQYVKEYELFMASSFDYQGKLSVDFFAEYTSKLNKR